MRRPMKRFPAAHQLPAQIKRELIDQIRKSLNESARAVEAALMILWERQTHDEKSREDTHETNSLGLAVPHASNVAYYAKWIQAGNHLSGKHLERARKIAHRYAATQLFELSAFKKGLVK